ncbi:MAG TPA: hypothetical protein VHX92_04470 [Rhizomicrobium sp.]|jgi:hypothetical protein|nr:hypothetical protein [Rhizomicrobium sp.]
MTHATKNVVPAKWVLARYLLIGAAGLAIAGCGKTQDQPSAALPPVAQGAPLTNAPTAESLPPAPAAPVYRVADAQASYAYPDRAYEMSDTFGDAPPDYVYDYGDVQPWVWVSDDGSERVAEAVPGGERYYYYGAGSDQPFFIQDPTYGYGFQGGRLTAVYDRSGRPLPDGDFQSRAGVAGRYLLRAHALYDASRNDRHLPVAESNWMARRETFATQRQTWRRQIDEDPDWRAYHTQNAPAVEAHWRNERVQRLKWAAHVDETMHNPDYATRERQQAQTVAAQPTGPSSQSRQMPLQERSAQHPGQEPQVQPAGPAQPERRGNFARHEPPQAAPAQQPPERFAQHPGPQPQAQPSGPTQPERHGNFARHEPPQAAPAQQLPERLAQHPAPQPPTPQPQAPGERRGNSARPEGAPPQSAPPSHMAMAPRHEPQASPPQAPAHTAPPPHQHVAARPQAHHAPPQGKDEQGKDDKHKHP